ncbi:uncharacterized protein LOC142352240 isoform X2 [Convolutriloba macropyga]|uniref:uncharacterized protein LOC142352240 isoform X2 n=1 Tax=Convolutriloba macropyga TaxID=536237 RepID=UPI003F51D36C
MYQYTIYQRTVFAGSNEKQPQRRSHRSCLALTLWVSLFVSMLLLMTSEGEAAPPPRPQSSQLPPLHPHDTPWQQQQILQQPGSDDYDWALQNPLLRGLEQELPKFHPLIYVLPPGAAAQLKGAQPGVWLHPQIRHQGSEELEGRVSKQLSPLSRSLSQSNKQKQQQLTIKRGNGQGADNSKRFEDAWQHHLSLG